MSTYGDDFLRNSKYLRGRLPAHRLDWSTKPPVYKNYPDAERFEMPKPDTTDGSGLWEVLQRRRSIRAYTDDPISLLDLSQLLWATQGISGSAGNFQLRRAPSAGALYPIETYLSLHNIDGLEKGIYHYSVPTHELELLQTGDFSKQVRAGALDQMIAQRAPVVFVWSAVFQRSKWKYLQRAYRYIFLDAGHIAQNLALASEALGLGSCQIGAIYDDEMNTLLELDGVKESVIYMSSVGCSRARSET